MEKKESLHRICLAIVGIVCLIATVIHGLWMRYIPAYPSMASLTPVQMETVLLLNAAVTLFLFMTGVTALAVALARTLTLAHLRAASLLLMAFWAGRFCLELAMPLQIPLLFIESPGTFARAFMLLPILILAIPFARR